MSARGDDLAVLAFAAQRERDARDFVVGAIVFRVHYETVQPGVVRQVARCKNPDSPTPTLTGEYPYYAAEFGNEWVAQTYSWRFFALEQDARVALAYRMERNIEDAEARLVRDRAKLAKLRAEIAKGPAPTVRGF